MQAGQHVLVNGGAMPMLTALSGAGIDQHMALSFGGAHGQQVQVLPAAAPGTQYMLVQQPTSVAGLPLGVFPMHALGTKRPAEPSYDSDDSEEGDGRGGKAK